MIWLWTSTMTFPWPSKEEIKTFYSVLLIKLAVAFYLLLGRGDGWSVQVKCQVSPRCSSSKGLPRCSSPSKGLPRCSSPSKGSREDREKKESAVIWGIAFKVEQVHFIWHRSIGPVCPILNIDLIYRIPGSQKEVGHPPGSQCQDQTSPCQLPPKGLLEKKKIHSASAHWRRKTALAGSSGPIHRMSPGVE